MMNRTINENIRIIIMLLAITITLLPAGCGHTSTGADKGTGTPLFDFLKDRETAAFVRKFEKSSPVAVEIASFEHYDSGKYRQSKDEETIRAVFNALSEIKVLEKTGDSGSAYYMETIQYIFRMPNDKLIKFGFHEGDLIYKGQQRYRIEGYENLRSAFWISEKTE